MATKVISIPVTLKFNDDVAKVIARAELQGVYSEKNASLIIKQLNSDGIHERNLAEYYKQLGYLVCCFAKDKRDVNAHSLHSVGFNFSELRHLYLPTLIATILSQVGDCKIGNYLVEVEPPAEKVDVNRDFIISMSEALYRNQHLLYCNRDQIGVANAAINADFMCNIITALNPSTKEAEVLTKDGSKPDVRYKALATFAGLSLVNDAYSILYPVIDYVYYGKPSDYYELKSKK